MENLLVYAFIEIIGNSIHKHTLGEITDFRCRDKAVKLRRNRGRFIITVDGHRLPLLENLTKTLRECLGGFSNYLPGEHITYCILNDLTFFVSIVSCKL